ncbi:hypothetical protein BOX15_Mlig026792g1 [Macrostomum lignano]|uniref:GDP-fucose pyrophosphorylase domain-containing protein n=1 Tax=Macrostomum lignano TaxID=282301 RepID=A0A267F4L0_9PLAT|nr:hypothetical protein BOX15_Mlig026792g1 [Macrostomum lignano]
MLVSPDFLLQNYKTNNRKTSFDIIAICASDSDQALGYKILGEQKFKDKLRIYSDPPGPKIGNGGALLHCLNQLRLEFGIKKLSKLRILFIPAGGMSQRSPWLSALGKLFAVMPTVSAGCLDMLDIVTALSEPFAQFAANAGVGCCFLACSDALLPYEFDSISLISNSTCSRRLAESDIVALAHPTVDLSLATGHGVYCVDVDQGELSNQEDYRCSSNSFTVLDCSRVLQKPTIAEMRSASGLIDSTDGSILIDSNFWLNGHFIEALLAWRDANEFSMAGVELDAYGDLLRGLGRDAHLDDYVNEIRNLTRPPSPSTAARLAQLRTSLFELLKGRQLKLCRIERSALVHIGSTKEYLNTLFQPIELARCFSTAAAPDSGPILVTNSRINIANGLEISSNGTGSALEFCEISARSCRIGSGCLLSHCRCREPEAELVIPDGWVLQTVPLLAGAGQVTWAWHSDDNPKQRSLTEAKFLGRPLVEFCHRHGLPMDEAEWSGSGSLWTARLFPCDRTWTAAVGGHGQGDQSLLTTLKLLRWSGESWRLVDWLAEKPEERRLMSMADIVMEKDTKALIEFRMTF